MRRERRTTGVVARSSSLARGIAVALVAGGVPATTADAGASFDFVVDQAIHVGSTTSLYVKVHCIVTNTTAERDSFDISRDRTETPAMWQMSICVGGEDGLCYAPHVNAVSGKLPLSAGQSDTISAYFTPKSEGDGYATITLQSARHPEDVVARTLGCVTDGCDVLVVDDDGGADVESFYESAVASAGRTLGTWRRELAPVHGSVAKIPMAVWLTGTNANTLDADDRQEISTYLAGGGRLVLSGQDVAYDLCDPASPNYTAESRAWFEEWMRSSYAGDASGSLALDPVPDDPVAKGLSLSISGGDGADNQTDPDVLAAGAGALAAWRYAGGAGDAAVHVLDPSYRIVLMAFGFEAISSEADRHAAMSQALAWLDPTTPILPWHDGVAPGAVALAPVRPNPSTSTATIDFSLERAGRVTLRILDSAGRLVRSFPTGQRERGAHAVVWDGRLSDGRPVAPGVYLVRLETAGTLATRKLVRFGGGAR